MVGVDRFLVVVFNRDFRKIVSLVMVSFDGKLGDRFGFSKRKSGYNKWNVDESLLGKCRKCSGYFFCIVIMYILF